MAKIPNPTATGVEKPNVVVPPPIVPPPGPMIGPPPPPVPPAAAIARESAPSIPLVPTPPMVPSPHEMQLNFVGAGGIVVNGSGTGYPHVPSMYGITVFNA